MNYLIGVSIGCLIGGAIASIIIALGDTVAGWSYVVMLLGILGIGIHGALQEILAEVKKSGSPR